MTHIDAGFPDRKTIAAEKGRPWPAERPGLNGTAAGPILDVISRERGMSQGETPDEQQQGTGGSVAAFPSRRAPPPMPEPAFVPAAPVVSFDRHELREIFNVYGRQVSDGEWRDYALDFLPEKAVFSIYRRASEVPLYRVEKDPALARRQGAYSVVAATGLILKRGPDLARVLQAIDRKPKLVVV